MRHHYILNLNSHGACCLFDKRSVAQKIQYISEIRKKQTKENWMELYTKLCFNNTALKLVPLRICYQYPALIVHIYIVTRHSTKQADMGRVVLWVTADPEGLLNLWASWSLPYWKKTRNDLIPSLLKENQQWLNRCCHKCTPTVEESPGANRHSRFYKEAWPNTMQASEYAKNNILSAYYIKDVFILFLHNGV